MKHAASCRTESAEDRLQCSVCAHSAYDLSALRRHVKSVHDKIRDHSCEECGMRFSVRQTLTRHMDSKHGNQSGRSLTLYRKVPNGRK